MNGLCIHPPTLFTPPSLLAQPIQVVGFGKAGFASGSESTPAMAFELEYRNTFLDVPP